MHDVFADAVGEVALLGVAILANGRTAIECFAGVDPAGRLVEGSDIAIALFPALPTCSE